MNGLSPGGPDSSPFCPELDAVAEESSCHDIPAGISKRHNVVDADKLQKEHRKAPQHAERTEDAWARRKECADIVAADNCCHDENSVSRTEKLPNTAERIRGSCTKVIEKVPSEDTYRPAAFDIGAPCTPPTSFHIPRSSTSEDLSSFDTSLPFFSSDSSLVVSPQTNFVHGHGPGLPGPAACPDACPVCLTPGCVAEESGERSSFVYHVGPKRERSFRVKKTLLLDEQVAADPPSPEVLCSERVSQMTRTYNDIEAVTRLLEEKEKDLELTARIGKELLSHNNKLEAHVATLEAELKTANDKIEQISHELVKKTELIQVLTNDLDESGSEAGTPTALRCINAELMQRKVKVLEDENKGLRREFAQLARDTESCEEQEQRLVEDIALQLANANVEREGMTGDLERQKEENRIQYEQISSLTAKLENTEASLRKVTLEYDEASVLLNITRDNQNSLAQELAEFKDRYAEVTQLLQDAQEDLRRQRKKGMPAVRGGLFSSLGASAPFGMPPADSLASELESSLYSELSLDSGISGDRIPSYKKAFETVKTGNQTMQRSNMASNMALPSTVLSSSGPRMSTRPGAACTSVYSSTYSRGGDSDYDYGTVEDVVFPSEPISGVPGVPGSSELADALRRLTPGEVSARRAALGGPPCPYGEYDAQFLPLGCRTPDSIMSTGSSSGYGGRNPWRLPDKLQIVKPMEGSATLHHWSQLATPTMGGLLEERPGVQTKGGRGLEDIGLHLYTLSDLEEDEEEVAYPGKSFQDSSSVYTYTDSRVMHPDDGTSVTHSLSCSLVGSRLCTGTTNSRQSTAPPTPVPLSRRNSCSTFSTSAGLAKLLNERGIDAATASALATPASEKSFTPTATPANSPDGSPLPSRSPSPTPFNPLKLPGFLSSGAELLRRTFISEPPPRSPRRTPRRSKPALSRSERKALTGIRIVEKLEGIGLDAMIASTSGVTHPTLQGALYARRGLTSPMAQLTSLKVTLGPQGSDVPAPPRLRSQRRASQSGKVRPDLGTVLGTVPGPPGAAPAQEAPSGPLGTISSMLFGRKGGLL